jgi:uncharacterized protein YjbJ (UPF0337 family)
MCGGTPTVHRSLSKFAPRFENPNRRRSEAASSINCSEDSAMNKDQIKGTAKDIGGKIQRKAGELVGSPEQQAKGLQKEVEGKAQKKVGDLKEAVKNDRKTP